MIKEWKPEYFIILVVLFVLISSGMLEGRLVEDLIFAGFILSFLLALIIEKVK